MLGDLLRFSTDIKEGNNRTAREGGGQAAPHSMQIVGLRCILTMQPGDIYSYGLLSIECEARINLEGDDN